ncbi:phosphopantetheinyl transferase family protein [Marvinbryantia formatexigens DSM 14469]|uniref:Phosphopantetheinyl transferase family protein n=1 Tax=Marvinbryantia formatexigens DSM 14469 TaxID=478749 RepID=C6L9V1_9FIRM|nr:4'-phosphopantetheinyl transferase superfamily protein [Marvinbryantia formatexigens]EET62358.1 phosphopantetheinyl transferase family protein [Marvinbryantia formatexigens DSM 14469]UWO25087.1 4'-phosphopantetheinyl transferase superfamily protein [Marvinbryantia formatexigens DSM 14469]SDG94909.1 4'-phosphopantetheinyl transferase superfamily protein [Marvinbryantia formatexigens]
MIYFCRKDLDSRGQKHGEQTGAARELLLAGLRLEYGIKQLPDIAADEMGKPYFPGMPQLFFNYSHCREGILCGISDAPIGVDLEPVREHKESLVRRVCHPREAALLQETEQKNPALTKIWVAKEAYLKYLGTGIRSDLRLLDMSAAVLHDEIRFGGCFLHFWRREDICMCACTEKPYSGELRQFEI